MTKDWNVEPGETKGKSCWTDFWAASKEHCWVLPQWKVAAL